MIRGPASLLRASWGASLLVLGLAVLGWQPAWAQPATPYPIDTGHTRDFLQSLGVNTHLEYTDGTYANYPRVIADLDFIGIHLLRDGTPAPGGGVPYANYITALHAAALAGNHFDFIAGTALNIEIARMIHHIERILADQIFLGDAQGLDRKTGINAHPVGKQHGNAADDAGATIRVAVTAGNPVGATMAVSAVTAPVT